MFFSEIKEVGKLTQNCRTESLSTLAWLPPRVDLKKGPEGPTPLRIFKQV